MSVSGGPSDDLLDRDVFALIDPVVLAGDEPRNTSSEPTAMNVVSKVTVVPRIVAMQRQAMETKPEADDESAESAEAERKAGPEDVQS